MEWNKYRINEQGIVNGIGNDNGTTVEREIKEQREQQIERTNE